MNIFENLFGSNDLLVAITNGKWDRVLSECERHPRKARIWNIHRGFLDGQHNSNILPLHLAVLCPDPSVEAINALIHAYPHAVLCKESAFKRLPLHLAGQNQAASSSTMLIRLLLAYAPDAAMERDSLGRVALHYACSNPATTVHAIDALLRVHPRAASCSDLNDWLPLHVACRYGASFLIIQRLLDAYPESVVARTERGSTPLGLLQHLVDCKDKAQIVEMLTGEMVQYEHMVPATRCYPRSAQHHHHHHRDVGGGPANMAAGY